jgi:hypothetical protein
MKPPTDCHVMAEGQFPSEANKTGPATKPIATPSVTIARWIPITIAFCAGGNQSAATADVAAMIGPASHA